jgi:hypothetical protein
MSRNSSALNFSPSQLMSESERMQFIIRNLIAGVRTCMPVQVLSVTNSGDASPIGTVSITPLVSMVTTDGQVIKHGTITDVPYMRYQGGGNAVIIDPQVGDIGMASFCDRDISSVVANGSAAAPASLRKHDLTDAIYHHAILAAAPTQYIQFKADGIHVVSPNPVTVTAPSILLGATGQTLLSFVTSAFVSLFNGHVHAASGSGVPTVAMSATQLSSTVKGA